TSEFEVALVAGDTIELDKREFHFGMTGEQRLFRRGAEIGEKEFINEAEAGIQKRAIAGGTVVGDGSLEKMADIVEFVAPLLRFWLHALGTAFLNVVGVEVAIGLLGSDDFADVFIDHGAEPRSIGGLECE